MKSPEYFSSKKSPELVEKCSELLVKAFGDIDPTVPVLGQEDEVILGNNLGDFLNRDDVVIVTTSSEEAELIGVNVVLPMEQMDPDTTHPDTAYIYYTAVSPSAQGNKQIAKLSEATFKQLEMMGYKYVEEDCVAEDGYADNVAKAYKDSITETYTHEKWTEIGPQQRFRIDISKALRLSEQGQLF